MRVGQALVVGALLGLTGCSGGAFNGLNSTGGLAGAQLKGAVYGGQQPIVGAQVYLFAAGATGYGGAGIAASASNASVSLLTSAANTTLDSSGGATNGDYYVTTDSGGNFSITGDYTCTAGQQVYLYALGGNPGSGTNIAAGLMAALGACPAAGNFLGTVPFIAMNEVSTVTAAYAFAGFATDATHVGSSGTALALTGIANAFANAANLASLGTGTALATTPAGNGTVPQAEINTLGNVLAACVNSTGAGSSACSTLFSSAESAGATGTLPVETVTAAINIAHNPGVNVAALYGLVSGTPPFAPGLTAQPNDWTVAMSFSGGGLSQPTGVAVDAAGNVWAINYNGGTGSGSVTKFSSSGSVLSGAGGYTGGGISVPQAIAIDPSGNAWIADQPPYGTTFPPTGVVKLSSSGVAFSGSPYFPIPVGGPIEPFGIAIDGSGNAWITSMGGAELMEVSSAYNSYSGPYSGPPGPKGVAIDASGNVWIAAGLGIAEFTSAGVNLSGSGGYSAGDAGFSNVAIDANGNVWATGHSVVAEVSPSGVALSGAGYTGGGINKPYSIAIDGADNVWITNTGSAVTELSNAGAALSPSTGYIASPGKTVGELAVDGSGNVWVTNPSGTTLVEMVGAGAPVVTPLSAGVKSGALGTRP